MAASNVYDTASCQYCPDIDTDDMVQCDQCDLWFHFVCVGVNSDVAKRKWDCDRCKYDLTKYPSLDQREKENHPPQQVQWRKARSIASYSSVSSKRSKILALQKLEEERVLSEKRDKEYLQQKYSILEDVIDDDDQDEHRSKEKTFDKLSFENVLKWKNDMQNLSKDYNKKFTMEDASITLDEDELTALNQRFCPLKQSSVNIHPPKSAIPRDNDRNLNVFATQRKSLDAYSPTIHQSTSNSPVDNTKATTSKVDDSSINFTSQNTNPFIKPGAFRFDLTKGSSGKSLQSGTVDRKLSSNTFNVSENLESFRGVRRKDTDFNLIRPSKLQFPVLRDSKIGKVRFDPIQSPKVQLHTQLKHQSQPEFHSVGKAHSTPSTTNLGFSGQSKVKEVEFKPKRSQFHFGFNSEQPKFEFDRFGNVESLNVENQPSMEQIRSSMQSSNPSRALNSNVPNDRSFGNNQSSSSVMNYGPTFDYRRICLSYIELTANQIASRHTMNKKLPQFYGDPIKWQMFDSAFIHSTISCGLTNSENLSRLVESLKGEAENAVKCRLLHPDSVPGVMETLRLMFGRPELVINALLTEITNTKPPKPDDLGSLVTFAISVQNLCATIQFYKSIEHLRNPTMMKSLTDKLPSQIQLNWAFYKQQCGEVTVSTLGDWLYQLATVASDVVTIDVSASKKVRKDGEISKNNRQENYMNVQNGVSVESKSKATNASKTLKKCPACNKDICKVLAYCETFKQLGRKERWNLVKTNNLCGCCLGNHRYFNCKQKVPCGIAGCSYFHHVLLHNDSKVDYSVKRVSNDNEKPKTCNSMTSTKSQFSELFRIVPVKLFFNGKSMIIYAYFDDGSNLTTLDKKLVKRLGLRGSTESLCVKWSFGDIQVESDSYRVSIQISGVQEGAETFFLDNVRTVSKLDLPTQTITKKWLGQYPYFKDIPITPYANAVPQMIIGLNYSKLTVSLETIEGDWEQPIVCRTRLGWVVQGPNDTNVSSISSNKISLNMCECQSSDNDLHQLVKEFFSLESFGVKISDRVIGSKELIRAQNILESSTNRKDNHYEAALLWRKDDITLPNSYEMAKRRLECVESKMRKNPVLAKRICDYLKDFLSKDYIRKLSYDEGQRHGPRTWYLPMFPVFNPKKPEKLRLVWDGAAKIKGVSLNSELLAGPDQLSPLPDILRRFREASIGLSTDIIEMFHRIYVNEEDQDSQRFLWRDGNVNEEPQVFVVKVLTFGSACSPAIAQFVKNKNAKEFEHDFPKAAEAILKNHYVDDMIERAHDVESAVKLINDVQFIHRHANFDLRNLISNSREVLEAINGSPEFNDKILVDKANIDVERILGMYWNTKKDTFTYSLQFIKSQYLTNEYCPTKREVLRIIMSVFDPLGFLAHFMIHAKVLLQEIWRNDIGWDVQLPTPLKAKWLNWIHHLKKVENLHIPRLYSVRLSPTQPKSIQLHVFVDASLEAYATSAYFRIEDNIDVDSCLIGAKTRVARNRPMSIPRLELQGAVLGTRFAESILQSHYSLNIEKTIIWCDSKTVLFWLNSEPRRYSQFVALRIGEILDSKIKVQWRWIPSEFNVADEATKTKNLPELTLNSRWFVGPEFLRNSNSDFSFELDEPDFTTDEEVRPYYLLTHLDVSKGKLFDFERFSTWQRLLRVMAYVQRFFRNAKVTPQERQLGIFSSNELLVAENCLYRQIQNDCFKEEILIIRWNETAPMNKWKVFDKSSIIRTCSPYLDEFGVLRVMGRLDNAHSISESAKRPIILAKNHFVTHLIVDCYHRKYRHLHHQTVLNEIRQKFWIPKLRVVLNGIRNCCQKCKNKNAMPRIPEMASIPKARLAVFTRPFSFVGLDYFGPINVIVNRGTQKRWGVLFTCMTTRAIHLEVAHSMDTSSCIMAIRNFEGRRGTPRTFYSDNGTNFHGANNIFTKELASELAKLDHDKIREEFVTSDTSWSFNPPTAAHMGGVWERMVGIVKICLDEVLTVRHPTDEMLISLFIEVERMVNSRPLTYVSLDYPDDEVLTPNHFLLGSSNGSKPPGEFTDSDLLRNTWRAIQAMSDKFWHKFVDEYLPTLTRRTKWFKKVEPLQVGDVVILVDSSFKRNAWPKGIVTETLMDKTGQVRSARVRTATGTIYQRPVSHLAKLDVVEPRSVKLTSSTQLTGERMFDNTDNIDLQ